MSYEAAALVNHILHRARLIPRSDAMVLDDLRLYRLVLTGSN